MTFQCDKCDKIFNREIDLNRHMNRKIPCNRKLQCPRCFKIFNIMGDLKRHINKKLQCYDKKSELELQIKLEQEKNKGKELELKIENAKKTHIQIAGRDINNTTNNINSFTFIPMNWNEAYDNTIAGDICTTLQNYFKFHYNNKEFPENKCIIIQNDKIYSIENDNTINFDKLKPYINKHVELQVNNILDEFSLLPDETLIAFGLPQRKTLLPNDKIKTVEKIQPFISNNRNAGIVKKQLISASD